MFDTTDCTVLLYELSDEEGRDFHVMFSQNTRISFGVRQQSKQIANVVDENTQTEKKKKNVGLIQIISTLQ